jgi:hypothetical protein
MFKKTAARVLAAGAVAAALVATSALAANAATPVPENSAGPFFLVDSETGAAIPEGTSLAWLKDVSGNPTASNEAFDQMFVGPADADGVLPFIAPRGQELNPNAYVAKAFGGFTDPAAKTVLLSPALLSSFTEGTLGANGVKAAGGEYSLGFAFTKFNGVAVASNAVYFTHITVTPGTGAWTFDTPTTTGGGGGGTEGGAFDVDLNADVITSAPDPDYPLSLEAPADKTVDIKDPKLVNGLSTSTGSLGAFVVKDGRFSAPKGWTLTTSTTDFKKSDDATKVIPASQLAITPGFEGTAKDGVTLAASHAASSGKPGALFAQSSATTTGDVTLNAGLALTAPKNTPAGTYNSTMTITLVSK